MENFNGNLMREMEVQNLSNNELQQIHGGIWQFVIGSIVGGMIYDLVFHTEDVIDSCGKGRDDAAAMWGK